MISNKFQGKNPVTHKEIVKMHTLLFKGPLQSFSEHSCSLEQIPENPHPTYLVKSLYNCVAFLATTYQTCEAASEAASKYISKPPLKQTYHPGRL